MSSRKTSVEIDEELLAGARSILGTRTVRETIEQAFLEVVRARARREEVQALASLKEMDLANPEVMAGAWRK